jgi:sarcosine oxidase
MASAYDVIVVGLGGMGSAAAYQLARRGVRVLGLERHGPAHAQGSSHGKSRIIRQAYFEDPTYVPLLLRAYELWQQIERESHENLLHITGGLMIGPPGSRTVAGARRSAEEHGLAHEMLDANDIKRRFPAMRPAADTIALFEAKAGFVHPEASVAAHLRVADRNGAELHFHEPVLHWEANTDATRVHVTTEHGSYQAGHLIISPGAWAPQLFADLKLPLVVERNLLFWFEPIGGRDQFMPGKFPIYIWEVDDNLQFYGFPAQDGPPGGVKAALFRAGVHTTPETIDRTIHPHEVDRLRECLATHIPALNGPLIEGASCMYTTSADEHFILGLHPRYPNVVVSSPCSGHGYKFATVIGEILADLATDGTTRHPIGLFDLQRFGFSPSR